MLQCIRSSATLVEVKPRAELDEERTEPRLQGLTDQLAAVEGGEAEDLHAELDGLEARIEEGTGFNSGASLHTRVRGEP